MGLSVQSATLRQPKPASRPTSIARHGITNRVADAIFIIPAPQFPGAQSNSCFASASARRTQPCDPNQSLTVLRAILTSDSGIGPWYW